MFQMVLQRYSDDPNGICGFHRNKIFIYNLISNAPWSPELFHNALALAVAKGVLSHQTSVHDQDNLDRTDDPSVIRSFSWEVTDVSSDAHFSTILLNERTNRCLFDVHTGRLVRCHLLRCVPDRDQSEWLEQKDVVLFNYHSTVADDQSILQFMNEFRRAWLNNKSQEEAPNPCFVAKQTIDKSSIDPRRYLARTSNVCTYLDIQSEPLMAVKKRFTTTLDLDQHLTFKLTQFMSEHHLTLFPVTLAVLHTFLFKLFDNDLPSIFIGVQGQNKPEFQFNHHDGTGVPCRPYPIQIDPNQNFSQFCIRVQQLWYAAASQPYPHGEQVDEPYPLSTIAPAGILFLVEYDAADVIHAFHLDADTKLEPFHPDLLYYDVSKFDLICKAYATTQDQLKRISFTGSIDSYTERIVSTMTKRLAHLLPQLFTTTPAYELSLLLPAEIELINNLNSTSVDYADIDCIHWDVARRAHQHPQKLALTLENASMTYAELLFYSQQLASHLITRYNVQPGDVVCQLVERSFEAIIGIIAIMMSAATYTALSSREPLARLQGYIEQTNPRLLLTHPATQHISVLTSSRLDIRHFILHLSPDIDCLSHLDVVGVTPDHISHIVFTSGSTGTPKGVSDSNL
jgi:hypothetical protein